MITSEHLERFLAGVRGQALREGTRYSTTGRVHPFVGTLEGLTTVVAGKGKEYEVALWPEDGRLAHRCSCPSWRDPCKHEVAAALSLRSGLAAAALPKPTAPVDPEAARAAAREERRANARRERLDVRRVDPPFLAVAGASGYEYRVQVRGGPDGPHGCDCPDFEANRLHTCKHVERVRAFLASPRVRLDAAFRRAAGRGRVFLHFGEIVEPRLFGVPRGAAAARVARAFEDTGLLRRPMDPDESRLKSWLARLDGVVEPEALAWLEGRTARRPRYPAGALRLERRSSSGPTPYPFQRDGALFLARTGRALLADEMGLGKTVQAILAARLLRRARPPVRSVTVVCPASLRGGWQDEIRKWTGEGATLLEGRHLARRAVIESHPRWLVTHYEQMLRDRATHAAAPPDLLIVDEAQRAKGLHAQTARALKSIGSRCLFALTGTPLENRLEEAYAIAQLIDQRLLPPLWQIDRDHFVRDPERPTSVLLYRNLGALRGRLAPAFLRRKKEDVDLQLPPRVRTVATVPMHDEAIGTYEEVMEKVAQIARKKVLRPEDVDRMQRLLVIARRCCDGPHLLGLEAEDRAIPKLAVLEDDLRELCLGEGRKVVVFSEWTDMTHRVEALCTRLGIPAFHLHGSVGVRTRPALIRAFSEQKGPAAFVSTDAGGVGLNLQAADVVVVLDLPWNPARLEQRIARVHRIGSRRTVRIRLVVCQDSIEHKMLSLHDTKAKVLANVWATSGEDEIAAPGGSGAFRNLVLRLLEPGAPGASPPRTREEKGRGSEGAPARGGTPVAPGSAAPPGRPAAGSPAGADRADRADRVGPGRGAGGTPAPAGGVDPAAVARVVAAVAPTLPADHRASLAAVFRALAEALAPEEPASEERVPEEVGV